MAGRQGRQASRQEGQAGRQEGEDSRISHTLELRELGGFSLTPVFAFCVYRPLFPVHATVMTFMVVVFDLLGAFVPSMHGPTDLVAVSLLLMCACDV